MSEFLLTVDSYGLAEKRAADRLSNRVIQAAHTESFNSLEFPTSCHSDKGIWRFGESMHEHSQSWIWDQILTGLTADECTALKELNFEILPKMCPRYYRPLTAGNSFLGPLSIGRHIKYMFPNRKLRILEIGAGSGYLSWYLARAGHQVISVDVSQGFYLYQNHLFKTAYGAGTVELATDERTLPQCLSEEGSARIIHLPWWKYYSLYEDNFDWSVDIVVSEANLTEMTSLGWQYAVWLARKILDRNNPDRFFGFRDWGYQSRFRHMDIFREFQRAGFSLPFTDNKLTVFAYCKDAPTLDPNLEHLMEHYRSTYPDWRRLNHLPAEIFSFKSEKWRNLILAARKEAEGSIVLNGRDFESHAKAEFNIVYPGGEDQHFSDFVHL